MSDSLDIEAHACYNLYHKSQEFIKSRKISQTKTMMNELWYIYTHILFQMANSSDKDVLLFFLIGSSSIIF